jgi:hypothetical protein
MVSLLAEKEHLEVLDPVGLELVLRRAAVLLCLRWWCCLCACDDAYGLSGSGGPDAMTASMAATIHRRGSSGQSWSRETTEDGNFIAPSVVLKNNTGVESSSNAFLV